MPDLTPYIDLGATAIIAIGLIYAIIQISKNKKVNGVEAILLQELQKTNQNHLGHIQDCIESGNRELIDQIRDDNSKIIEILGRIDGKLSR